MTIKVTPQLIAEIRTILQHATRDLPPFEKVLKWNRNQPRGPKGSPTGGRWVAGASAGEGTASSTFKPPEYGFGSSEDRRMARANQASYAAIMNAPTGEGFHNRPRGVGIPEPVEEPKGTKTLEALKNGSSAVKDSRPLGGNGCNASAIVTLEDGTEAVYKPERGENWHASFSNHDISRYIKNKDFSLAEREAFAFEVDQAMGLGIVPETVLHEHVDETHVEIDTTDDGGGGGGGYDSDELREMYEKYEEKARDQAYEAVGEEMEQLYQDAKAGHAEGIKDRAEELNEIWNEEIKDYPDEDQYGSGSALAEHPVLPLGSQGPFERKDDQGALDPLEVMDEAGVDYEYALNTTEKNKIREIIRKRLAEGYSELGDVDEDVAKEHLDRDKFIEDHADTENRLMDSKVQGYESWKQSNYPDNNSGYGGGGSGEDRNPDAPHPQGGSFQHFRGDADDWGTIGPTGGAKLAVLDYLIGTMDRHGQNLMFDGDEPVAIDNGYSMPATSGTDDFQFRSDGVGSWMSSHGSRNVPSELRAQLHDAVMKTDWQAMVDRHPNMNAKERQAFLSRVENMKIALQTEEGLRELWENLNRM